MVTEVVHPWLFKESRTVVEVTKEIGVGKEYYLSTPEGVPTTQLGEELWSGSDFKLSSESGKCQFLPDGRVVVYRILERHRVLELQLIAVETTTGTKTSPLPVRFHFAAPILPSVGLLTTEVGEGGSIKLVCWVGLVNGELHRLTFDGPDYFLDRRWGLFRSQPFTLRNSDPQSQLVLFHPLDPTSVVVATTSGTLLYGQLESDQRYLKLKEWVQPSLISGFLSSLYRFAPNVTTDSSHPLPTISSPFQTIALVTIPLPSDHHLVLSLCRDHNLRLWSSRTHQLVWSHPLSNFTVEDVACEMPTTPLPPTIVTNVLRVHQDPRDPTQYHVVVYTRTDAGATFLVYKLTLNSQSHPITFDLSFWLIYRRGLDDLTQLPHLQDMVIKFPSLDRLDAGEVPQLYAIWSRPTGSCMEYISLPIYGNTGGIGYPFRNIGERWLPIVPPYHSQPSPPSQLDLTSPLPTFDHAVREILFSPHHYSTRILTRALHVYFSGSSEFTLYQETSYAEMVETFLTFMKAKFHQVETYRSELQRFLMICDSLLVQYRQPLTLTVSPLTNRVYPVYGDALGGFRTCHLYEVLSGLASHQIPSWSEYLALSEHLRPIASPTLAEVTTLVSVFRSTRDLWSSGMFDKLRDSLEMMERNPDTISVLTLLAEDMRLALEELQPTPWADKIRRLTTEAMEVRPILNSLVHHLTTPPDPSLPDLTGLIGSSETTGGSHFENGIVASACQQIALCKFEISRCLVLIQALLVMTVERSTTSEIQRDDLVTIDTTCQAYLQTACSRRLTTTTKLPPQTKWPDSLLSRRFLKFDVSLTRFPPLSDEGMEYDSILHDFLRTIPRFTLDPIHLTSFADQILFKTFPGPPESRSWFYPLLSYLESHFHYDSARHQVKQLPLGPEQQFLLGRIHIKRGDSDQAHKYFAGTHLFHAQESRPVSAHPLRFLLPDNILMGDSISFLHYIAEWFQACGASDLSQLLCQQALVESNSQEVTPTVLAQQSQLWQLSFDAYLTQNQYAEAYHAITNLPDPSTRYFKLRALILKMGESGAIDQFYQFSSTLLETVIETVLWDLVGTMTVDSVDQANYFDILTAYHFSRNEPYGMAMAQYHYVLWLLSHQDLPNDLLSHFLVLQIVASKLSAHSLSSCSQQMVLKTRPEFISERQRLAPLFGPTSAPIEIMTESMLIRLNTMLMVQQNLASLFPQHGLLRHPAPVDRTVELLLASHQFEMALQVLAAFELDLLPAIRSLTAACLQHPEQLSDTPQETGSSPDPTPKPTPNPWRQLEAALRQYPTTTGKPGAYTLEVISLLLAADYNRPGHPPLPNWLTQLTQDQNLPGYVRLLLHHHHPDLAYRVVHQFLNQHLTHPTSPSTPRPFLPINLVDQLVNTLEAAKDPRLPDLQLMIDRYLALP